SAMRYLYDENDTVARAFATRAYRNDILGEGRPTAETATAGEELLPDAFRYEKALLRQMPLYELCTHLMEAFCLDRSNEPAFLSSFLDEVLDFLADNASDLGAFLNHWDRTLSERAIPSAETSGIRILTIHKAKGLAFHSVFIPYCDWEMEDSNKAWRNIVWWKPAEAAFEGLPLVPVSPVKEAAESIYARQYETDRLERRVYNLNLAYVAFTRARQHLFIWCKSKKSDKKANELSSIGSLTAAIVESEAFTAVQPVEDVSLEAGFVYETTPLEAARPEAAKSSGEAPSPFEHLSAPLPMTLQSYRTRAQFVQSTAAKLFVGDYMSDAADAEGYDVRNTARGNLLHSLFSAIATAADIPAAVAEKQRAGLLPTDADAAAIVRYMEDKTGGDFPDGNLVRSWFDGSWTLFNEHAILLPSKAGTIRPDRVMVRGAAAVVVDYKFGAPHASYPRQVRKYMQALREMGYTDVRGYLWYVDRNRVEAVAPEAATDTDTASIHASTTVSL
ncbi:MAG: hypothetical protein IJ729_02520, partial [Alloprevotella sp.]|nr:hypothetical protein [Alloprevotella sp.]